MKSLAPALLVLLLALPGAAQSDVAALLPAEFAGWHREGAARVSTSARAADSAYAGVLEEYGFERLEEAAYTRDDRRISVRAIRFQDTTGSYGAFTFYKRSNMQTEQIGDQGASAGRNRVLFYRGNILTEAEMDRITAMTAAELRALAAALPVPAGPEQRPPTLPTYLPPRDYIPHTAKFVFGPRALAHINAPLPAEVVGFERGAEAVLGRYQTAAGILDLMILSYPTPQIASQRLTAVEDHIHKLRTENPNAMPAQFLSRRSGPLVAVAAGSGTAAEANSLLAAVVYDADVTWSERVPGERDNVGRLILGAFTLAGLLIVIMLVASLALGGFRALFFKLFPRLRRSDEEEFIALDISGTRGQR
jgi:hypothetical protein